MKALLTRPTPKNRRAIPGGQHLLARTRLSISSCRQFCGNPAQTVSSNWKRWGKSPAKQTPTKLNEEQLSVLAQLVEAQNDATLKELWERLEEKTGVSMSCPTIHQMFNKLNLSVKKNFDASEKETERVQQQRVMFWQ